MTTGWLGLLRSLGASFLGVLRAELAMLKEELQGSGRRLLWALGLLALAVFLLFWAIAAGAVVLFEVLALWLPAWGAALCVFGLLVTLGSVLAMVARGRLRALESPAETVRRRLDDHTDWWHEKLLAETSDREPGVLSRGDSSTTDPIEGS